MKTGLKCIICQEKTRQPALAMCLRCSRAYDRVRTRWASTLDLMQWVAERVRRHERKRSREARGKGVREWLGVGR